MILSGTKASPYAAENGLDYSLVYMLHRNTVYGHSSNYDYGRLFISIYSVYDFITELQPFKEGKWLLNKCYYE